MKKFIGLAVIMLFAFSLTGCGYLLAGGAGAAGGYILRDQGYKVQSPVKKEGKPKSQSEKKSSGESKTTGEKTTN